MPPAPGADVTSRPPATDAGQPSPTAVVRRQPEDTVTPGEPVTYRPTPDRTAPPTGPPQFAPGGPPWPPAGGPPAGGPPRQSASDVLRYGPGVPASQAGEAAESVWRTGHRPGPPPRQARLRQLRRVLGSALTVILLVAAGVVVWLRFFDHSPFHVTKVSITQQTKTSCGVNVTGEIMTNGSAGTVSYEWVFQPQAQAPQPLSQSVTAGQHDVLVTVAVQGQGHGNATQKVTLDVLGPDTGSASSDVTISC
ncbi:MAG TPA: hypothetical protein VGS06_17485 [Streptosporangiaceae bacterium]|nr:hypothetical protein [Streptosporangiaceae bacterium]